MTFKKAESDIAKGLHTLIKTTPSLTSGAALRILIAQVPKFFDSILVDEDPGKLLKSAVFIVHAVICGVAGFDPGSSFSKSPEYQKAVGEYLERIKTQKETQQETIHAG